MRSARLTFVLALVSVSLACSDDAPSPGEEAVGDGDGDPGDGDGDPGETGDGDGDGEPGDGDGEPGDGDGEPGDGDGEPGDGDGEPGDGDGDPLPSLPPGFLDELTDAGGCGDVYIGVTNGPGTMGILFSGAELAVTAHMLGETQTRESTLPSDDVSLRIALGSALDDGCNDAGEGQTIDTEWIAVSGTVTLTVVPKGEAQPWQVPADATLELSNVSFEGDGVAPVFVETWIVEDVDVGWFPG
jgi:hypothetical protein